MSGIPMLETLSLSEMQPITKDVTKDVGETMDVEPKRLKVNVFHLKKDIRFVEDQLKVNGRMIATKKQHKGQEELIELMQKHHTNLVNYHKRLCDRVRSAYQQEVAEMDRKNKDIEKFNH
jgi:hypothetical protein